MSRLTPEQEAVANHMGGHALVSAVAGSGKTTTMIERVGRLLGQGVPAHRIICLMFNKSAQLDFQRKLRRRVGASTGMPDVRTYHSLGNLMNTRLVTIGELAAAKLEKSSGRLEQQARQAVNVAWQKQKRGQDYPDPGLMEAMPSFITRVKATVRTPAQVFADLSYDPRLSLLISAFEEFELLSQQKRVMYYDDQIRRAVCHVIKNPRLWDLFNGYDEIIVDEFQDTNEVQFEMLRGIASGGANVMAVGDDDQAIYAFRGSSVTFILKEFPTQFAPCTRYPITTTFRYGHETCLAAANVISRNVMRTDKFPVAHPNNPDTRIHIQERISVQESGIVSYLHKLQEGDRLDDAAMLVRFYAQALPYELELWMANIPFHVYGRQPLLFVPEIAALFSALCIGESFWDLEVEDREVFLQALLKAPSMFLPRHEVENVARSMAKLTESQPLRVAEPIFALAAEKMDRPGPARKLRERAETVQLIASGALRGQPPSVIVETYLRMTGMLQVIAESAINPEKAQEGVATIRAFTDMVASFSDTRALLDTLSPMAAFREDKPPQQPHLKILSLHGAKGLEYDTVFLPGWSTGAFPRQDDDLEEDRRLAYVGITRAQRNLVFLTPPDEGFRAWVSDPAALPHPGTPRMCSDFLFDADPGLCRAVARQLRDRGRGVITARDPRMAKRYVQALGRSDVVLDAVPGADVVLAIKAITSNTRIEVGMRVSSEDKGECEVVRLLYGPVYQLRQLLTNEMFPTVLSNSGWVLVED